jgi:phage shock protein C
MFCTKCGSELRDQDNFCFHCGATTARGHSAARPTPALSRPMDDRMIAGVCAGFARYMGIDVALIRILWVVLSFSGVGLIAYLVAWIVMPKDTVTAVVPVRASS